MALGHIFIHKSDISVSDLVPLSLVLSLHAIVIIFVRYLGLIFIGANRILSLFLDDTLERFSIEVFVDDVFWWIRHFSLD
jgi:hypothetical protein